MNRWMQMLTRLGRAFLDWLAAELEQLAEDLRGSTRQLARAIGLLATAAVVLVFAVATLTAAAVAALSLVMAVWAAALTVGGVLVLKAIVLAWVGVRILKRIENPSQTFARRWAEQESYWKDQLLAGQPGEEPPTEDSRELIP